MKKYFTTLLAAVALGFTVHAQIGGEDSYCAPDGNWVTHTGAEQAIFGNLINDAIGNKTTSTTASTGVNHASGGKVYFYNHTNGAKAIKDGPLALAYGSLTSNYNGGGAAVRFYELVTDNTASATNVASGTVVNTNGGSGAISIEQEVCITKEHFFVNGTNWTPRSKWKHAYIHYDDNAAVYSGAGSPNTTSKLQIDGYSAKTGSSAFTFPIGDGIYLRNSALSAPGSGIYKTAYFNKNFGGVAAATTGISGNVNTTDGSGANCAGGIKKVNRTEGWDIDGTASSQFTLWALNSVAGYSDWGTAANFAAGLPAKTVITGFDLWENLGITAIPSAHTNDGAFTTTVATTPDVAYSIYTWANTDLILPVHISDWKVSIANCKPVAKWTTSAESNSSHFDVERSANGLTFSKVGTVAAAGYSNLSNAYSFADVTAPDGKVYYRVKMVDKDQTFKVTSPLLISSGCGVKSVISIYPNPFVTNINISLNADKATNATIKVTNDLGQVVATKPVSLSKGQNTMQINLAEHLANGVYLLEVIETNSTTLVREKLVKN